MRPEDRVRLLHMRDAAREAIGFTAGRTRDDLETDRQLLLAIVKDVEIVGEAASRLDEAFRIGHPELPWKAIVTMRNRLVHAYFNIDHDIVWNTVIGDLPDLVAVVEAILRAPEF